MGTVDIRPARRSAFVNGALLIAWLAAAMWIAELLDYALPVEMDFWGIEPRTIDGLTGVVLGPFLHGDFGHLAANTVPFLVLGLLVAWRAGPALFRVLAVITILGGLGVWLLAPGNVITIGASGVVFGLLGYLVAAGAISRRPVDIVISVVVLLVYGGTLAGATPIGVGAGVSWLAHLMGLAAGVLAAMRFAPRRRAAGASASIESGSA